MAHLKRRMVDPELFAHPDLEPAAKRLLYIGAMSVAEDSGCLSWSPGLLKALVLPLEDASVDDVTAWMRELDRDGLAWPYELEGRPWAYLPDFHRWQGKMIRWNAPESVPLPTGLLFTPSPAKERSGSGFYEWPTSRNELNELNELKQVNESNEEKEEKELKEPARTMPATSALPADDGEACAALAHKLGKERTAKARRLARGHALEHRVEVTDALSRFYLEAEDEAGAHA